MQPFLRYAQKATLNVWAMAKSRFRRLSSGFTAFQQNDRFLDLVCQCVQFVAKLLSIVLVLVIFVSVIQLLQYFVLDFVKTAFTATPNDTDVVKDFTKGLFTLFGLVLNALIAIELLENLGGYLSRHILQVELVISTSLIAVARKIIILDLEKTTNLDILAFAATILALAVAYWVVRSVNPQAKGH
jgi:uncharacterized membrane protein (DUF373 family)